MAVRRRRRAAQLSIGGAVIVLILIGVTGGGREGDQERDGSSTQSSSIAPNMEPALSRGISTRDAATVAPTREPAPTHAEAPASSAVASASQVETVPATPVIEPAEAVTAAISSESAAVYDDLLASCIRVVEHVGATGTLDRAARALQEAEGWPLDKARKTQLAAARRRWRAALDAGMEAVCVLIASGRVCEAYARASALAEAEDRTLQDHVAAVLGRREWPGWRVAIGAAERPVPSALLDRGRKVRVFNEGSWWTCKVVEERSGEVTVRIRTRRGDLFPVFPRATVEPVAVTATEALDQAAAAIGSGDALRAALWLGCAKGREDLNAAHYAALARCLCDT